MDVKLDGLRADLSPVAEAIRGRVLDTALAAALTARFPPGSQVFERLRMACIDGTTTGWMGLAGDDRRKGGRVIEPSPDTAGCSVDVVELCDITGPHHSHPGGEICAVFAETPGARFDGNPDGWAVYPAGSAHWPSATGGRLRVLFFLPDGAITYTDAGASLGSGSTVPRVR